MCYDMSARPPIPAASTASPGHDPRAVGVVVLPDIRGRAPFYDELCVRLAEAGHPALAVDWYGHDAPLSRAQMQDDVMSAVQSLRDSGIDNVVALGFCMGGRVAFLMAAGRFGLQGVIGFYGAPGAVGPYDSGPTGLAHELRAPILALFGDADEGITPQARAAFGDALSAAGVPHEIVTYPGAPHGFFDAHQDGQEAVCADAWRRVLAFLDR